MTNNTTVVRAAAYVSTGVAVALAGIGTHRLWSVISYNDRTLMILVLSLVFVFTSSLAFSILKENKR